MPDVWPYGPPRYTDWQQCYDALLALGLDKSDADILAAIGGPESSYDLAVVNDTPATGDYSVGVWQINYYGSLYAGRVADFGTPRHLAQSTVSVQAKAALQIFEQQGYGAWATTYDSGAYKAYEHGTPAGPPPQHQLQAPDTTIHPPTGDYAGTIVAASKAANQVAGSLAAGATAIRNLGR